MNASDLNDPRSQGDFDSRFYPKADGTPPPSIESADRNDRIKREFCAVYYQLNRRHASLTELRKGRDAVDDDQIRALMQQIEQHLRLRDELEDRYTPFGVIAEAIAQDGFTVDVKFTFGDRTVFRRQRTQLISSTALLFFPAAADSVSKEGERNRESQGDNQ